MAEGKGLDLKNPGGKEILIAGGVAVVIGVVYLKLHPTSSAAGSGGGAGVPASGHGLGSVPGPQLQTFFPGGGSGTGNALTDSLFTTPATATPGESPIVAPTVTGINGNVPVIDRHPGGGGIGSRVPEPRIGQVFTPVQHVSQGAQDILNPGGVNLTANTSATVPVAPTTGLSSQWSGTLFTGPSSPLAWAQSLLKTGHFPQTTANLQSLIAWALNENTTAQFNPLATTEGSQYPAFNGIGVRNFPNWNVGIGETLATIYNGRYPNIVAGLQSGHGIGSNAGGDLLTWSGRGYSQIAATWNTAGGILARLVAQQKAASAAAAAKAKAAQAVKVPTAAQIAGLFPKVGPAKPSRARPHPAPARARPVYHSVGSIGAALARFAATFRPRPAPRPRPLTQAPHHQRFVGGY